MCSDTSGGLRVLWHNQTSTALDSLAVLMIIPLIPNITRNSFWTEKLRDHMAQQAFHNQYKGDWKLVQEILELKTQTPYYQVKKLLEHKDTYFLFGNLLPRMERLSRGFKARLAYKDVLKDYTPVRRPQRKRGYNDKGTLPDSQKLGIEYYFEKNLEPKEDRRSRVWEPRSHEWLFRKKES